MLFLYSEQMVEGQLPITWCGIVASCLGFGFIFPVLGDGQIFVFGLEGGRGNNETGWKEFLGNEVEDHLAAISGYNYFLDNLL